MGGDRDYYLADLRSDDLFCSHLQLLDDLTRDVLGVELLHLSVELDFDPNFMLVRFEKAFVDRVPSQVSIGLSRREGIEVRAEQHLEIVERAIEVLLYIILSLESDFVDFVILEADD